MADIRLKVNNNNNDNDNKWQQEVKLLRQLRGFHFNEMRSKLADEEKILAPSTCLSVSSAVHSDRCWPSSIGQ